MAEVEVWFAIPSANPANCRRVLPQWRERGYRVVVLQNRERASVPADITVWRESYPGWAVSINELCRKVVPRSASVIVTGGDDMLPDPSRTAAQIGREFIDRFPDGFGVMQPTGDGYLGAGQFCGSPWLGRGWIDRAYRGCGPMPSGYRHNWADNELFWVAKGLDALWLRDDLSQQHEHFSRQGQTAPDYWTKNVSAHDQADVERFIARAWLGFEGCEPRASTNDHRTFDRHKFKQQYTKSAERYWLAKYASDLASEPEIKLRTALDHCAEHALRRVGIYGAGTHTRLAAGALAQPPVEVVCIIEDTADRNARMWGLPLVSLQAVDNLNLDAIIISSRTVEGVLARKARAVCGERVEIIRLYSSFAPQSVRENVTAMAGTG